MQVNDETVVVFKTWSGSRYEISKGKVRRLNAEFEKRADGEWLELHYLPEIWIGQPVTLVFDSLSGYGADDVGNQGPSELTVRRTSDVVSVDVKEGRDESNIPF